MSNKNKSLEQIYMSVPKSKGAYGDHIAGLQAIANHIRETEANEAYGRGVSVGKKEALCYSPQEREAYGKWVAQNEFYKSTEETKE